MGIRARRAIRFSTVDATRRRERRGRRDRAPSRLLAGQVRDTEPDSVQLGGRGGLLGASNSTGRRASARKPSLVCCTGAGAPAKLRRSACEDVEAGCGELRARAVDGFHAGKLRSLVTHSVLLWLARHTLLSKFSVCTMISEKEPSSGKAGREAAGAPASTVPPHRTPMSTNRGSTARACTRRRRRRTRSRCVKLPTHTSFGSDPREGLLEAARRHAATRRRGDERAPTELKARLRPSTAPVVRRR